MIYNDEKGITRVLPMIAFFLLLFLTLLFTHLNLISNDPLSDYDDNLVVKPMAEVNSINHYIANVKAGTIIDRQPVRDFSYWIDYLIKKNTGISIFHLHNLLIWFGIAILFFMILREEEVSQTVAMATVSLYSFHPCLTNAVAWLSARKHLLSELYILASTLLLIRALKSNKQTGKTPYKTFFFIALLYTFSCFSQPINIMWPIWGVGIYFIDQLKHENRATIKTFYYSISKRMLFLFAALFGIALIIYLINTNYYTSSYVAQFGVKKYVTGENNNFSLKLLSYGASIFQIMIPIWPTPSGYYPGSLRNMIGIALMVFFLAFVYKRCKNTHQVRPWGWVLFSTLPLIVTTMHLTNIFGSDTYLLVPTLGIYIIAATTIFKNKWFAAFLIPVLLFFLNTSNEVSNSWLSAKSLWTLAQQNYETPSVVRNLSNIYFNEQKYQTSYKLAAKLWAWNPKLYNSELTYSQSLYAVSGLGVEQKISLFNEALKQNNNSSWINYFLSRTYFDLKNWKRSYEYLKKYQLNDLFIFGDEVGIRTAELEYICLKGSETDKNQCRTLVENAKRLHMKKWNQTQYENKLDELKGLKIKHKI